MGKIMVVDDEPAIRDLVTAILMDQGHTVVAAADGREALERAPSERPDLFVMDIMMPMMDGREALRRLRELPDFRVTPIIMLSAAVQVDGRALGVSAFLRKPFEVDQLIDTVARVLDEPSAN